MLSDLPFWTVVAQIIRHTPPYVWAILLALVALGLMQWRDHIVSRARLALAPIGLGAFSLWGTTMAFGAQPAVVVAWLAGIALAIAANRWLRWPRDVRPTADGRFALRASPWPLIAMMTRVLAALRRRRDLGVPSRLGRARRLQPADRAGLRRRLGPVRRPRAADPEERADCVGFGSGLSARTGRPMVLDSTSAMTHVEPDRWHYLRHAAVVAGFSAVVALGLVIAKGGDWALQFIYAEAIGLSIWACTDFGRLLFKRDPESNWPTGWRMIVMQVGAVIVGYAVGTSIGDLYCGCSTFELWQRSPRTFAGYFVLCVAVTVAICFFFLTRGRDQRRLRQIATAQRDASEAQLKLLESQLEPHMLFNTLANLRVLIAIDPPRAQAMLDQLIAFLRATLSGSQQPFHALSAEFARLSDYLAADAGADGRPAADAPRAAARAGRPAGAAAGAAAAGRERDQARPRAARRRRADRDQRRADRRTHRAARARHRGRALGRRGRGRHALRSRPGARAGSRRSTAPRRRSICSRPAAPKAAPTRSSPCRPERRAANTMHATALIAEDEALLAAELQAQLARALARARDRRPGRPRRGRGRGGAPAASAGALSRHPDARHDRPRGRAGDRRGLARRRRRAADRVRDRLRPVRARGLRPRRGRLPAEADRCDAPRADLRSAPVPRWRRSAIRPPRSRRRGTPRSASCAACSRRRRCRDAAASTRRTACR